jgi:adenine specific DNA methylase Mod
MNSAWALNLSSLPTPKTSLESIQQWDVRKKQILEELASKPLPPFDSKADYRTKITLPGADLEQKPTVLEQFAYADTWKDGTVY